jgi:hypothetical protein
VLEYHAVRGREPSALVDRLEALGLYLVRADRKNGVGTYWLSR